MGTGLDRTSDNILKFFVDSIYVRCFRVRTFGRARSLSGEEEELLGGLSTVSFGYSPLLCCRDTEEQGGWKYGSIQVKPSQVIERVKPIVSQVYDGSGRADFVNYRPIRAYSREAIELCAPAQIAEFLPCELKQFLITCGNDELALLEIGFEQADNQVEEGVGIQVIEMSHWVI